MIYTITGPRSVGKTTISKRLAKKIKLNYISSDEIGEKVFEKEGGLDKAIKSGKIGNFINNSSYGLIRREYEKDNFVFDLSGGAFTSEKYSEASKKVRKIAKKNSKIIGILPSKNEEKSINFLFEREKNRIHFKKMCDEELFNKTKKDYVKFEPLFKEFCDLIVYVMDKSTEEIVNEIIN
tara:strand:- start:140 stop:679 length:540 start_codon:yes stop_codon:yes gene_type:complete